MKTTTIAAALAGLIASSQAQYFSLTAVRSGSAIHLQSIAAAGERLYVGGNTATYCPSEFQSEGLCPNATGITNFADGNGELLMGAEVPGKAC